MSLRTVPIRRIGLRHALFMGGDREMVLTVGAMSAGLVFAAQSWTATFYGAIIWIFAVWVARLAAKHDPQLRHIYLRHIKYQAYYAPRSTPFRRNNTAQAKRFR